MFAHLGLVWNCRVWDGHYSSESPLGEEDVVALRHWRLCARELGQKVMLSFFFLDGGRDTDANCLSEQDLQAKTDHLSS